ncbi:hypothetical protein H6G08_34790 [Calothrix anomala FACHB-343]|uniref:Uncharacterized protein n=2 Tax=Calothrix TaxID=1186 RepID=A0ABR8AKK2_9CYAN|nr:hypothetical protein [Calothrix parietina FACHB-288]MBD2229570.1 hypothetical protein [Calothrix anomala FACHB-343]
MIKQIDFRWRYQPCKETDVKLMRYIQSNRIKSKTEIMLVAVRSFWLIHAIIGDSQDKENVQRLARSCIQALKKQAQEIEELAGLPELSSTLSTQYLVNSTSDNVRNQSLEELREASDKHVYDDAGLSNFM